jgi:hypothetical protein
VQGQRELGQDGKAYQQRLLIVSSKTLSAQADIRVRVPEHCESKPITMKQSTKDTITIIVIIIIGMLGDSIYESIFNF